MFQDTGAAPGAPGTMIGGNASVPWPIAGPDKAINITKNSGVPPVVILPLYITLLPQTQLITDPRRLTCPYVINTLSQGHDLTA